MKIGIYLENYRQGGVDRVVIDTINHWPSADDEFVLFCNDSHPGRAAYEKELRHPASVVSYPTPAGMRTYYPERGGWNRAYRVLYDSVGCFLAMPWQVHRIGGWFRRHELDTVIVHNGGWPGARSTRSAAVAARLAGTRCLFVIHNLVGRLYGGIRMQERMVEALLARLGVTVTTVSRAAAESLSIQTGLPEAVVVANGIRGMPESGDRDGARAELNLPGDAFVLGMLGTFEPRRGHGFLIEALRHVLEAHPSTVLVVAGSGSREEQGRVRELVAAGGVGHAVRLLGFQESIAPLIAAVDVVVNPVQAWESFGLVALEAMSAGRPVVATRVGGVPEVVVDGETGFLVSRDDPRELAARLVELAKDPELRHRMGKAGREHFRRSFTASRMATDYCSLAHEGALAMEARR